MGVEVGGAGGFGFFWFVFFVVWFGGGGGGGGGGVGGRDGGWGLGWVMDDVSEEYNGVDRIFINWSAFLKRGGGCNSLS